MKDYTSHRYTAAEVEGATQRIVKGMTRQGASDVTVRIVRNDNPRSHRWEVSFSSVGKPTSFLVYGATLAEIYGELHAIDLALGFLEQQAWYQQVS